MPHASPSAATRTTCCYCGVGCGIVVDRDRTGRLRLAGDPDHPTNRGLLCSKGRMLLQAALDRSGRLLHPAIRPQRGVPARRATWGDAIGHAASALLRIRDAHGPDSIAVLGSGQWLTEEYYLINKLVKGGLGTNNLDTNSRLCMSSAVAGYARTLGSDAQPCTIADLELTGTILVSGANPAWCHPIIWRRVEAAKKTRPGLRIAVVDPRTTDTADAADLHLRIRPGTDVPLHLGLARILIHQRGIDRAFVDAHTTGFAEYAAACEPWTIERTAATCGIEAEQLLRLAGWLADPAGFVSAWAMGLNQAVDGVDRNATLIALHLLTGAIGRPGAGPFSLTGQPNAMGGREVGGMATLLSNHRSLASASDRAEVARAWGVPDLPAKPGVTATQLTAALAEGRVKAVWICATNPVESLPDATAFEAALGKAELVIAQDAFATATTDLADVILPAATWLEKRGTMTNSERRIALLRPAIEAPGEALPDAEIFRRMAHALDRGDLLGEAEGLEARAFAEHAALSKGRDCDISGLSHARLAELRAPAWPVPDPASTGTERLFTDRRFATSDGRARLVPPSSSVEHEPLDPRHPLVLTTTRLRDQWHTRTRTGRLRTLTEHAPVPRLEIHPDDAAARGIADGDVVDVVSRRGLVRVLASATDRIRPGAVALPMHFGKKLDGRFGRTNACTSPLADPVSQEPDLKYAAVQVARHVPPTRRIVVAGAGAAALAFVRALRAVGREDPVLVVGDEPRPVYNRVALPHYIAGEAPWDELIRADRAALAALGADFRAGVRATAIDAKRRILRLGDGGEAHYDVLVLATGSRPARTFQGRQPAVGVHVLRHRDDADAIRTAFTPGEPVAVVGGGVLGIELADALAGLGAQVTVLQRSDRLMGRLLDAEAAGMLAEHLRGRGIAVRFNARLDRIEGEQRVEGLVLEDGTRLPCRLVVFATGTAPNAEIARAAVITCSTGVIVDRDLRTSDPSIHAIGEVAEYTGPGRQGLAGTTAACVAQAGHLAEVMRGNPHHPYAGPFNPSILKVHDLPLAACGETDPAPGAGEIVAFRDAATGVYHKAVVRDDRVVGAICVGDTAPFAELVRLAETGTELADQRNRLLRGGASAPVRGRLVCSCLQVGEDTIREAAMAQGGDAAKVCAATRAGTGCGSCGPEVARICAAARPAPAAATAAA